MRHDDYISEGYALSEWLEAFEPLTKHNPPLDEVIDAMRDAFVKASGSKVGSKIKCPGCGKSFVKKTYHHKFCSSKGRANCKDFYWNTTDDTRRNRAKEFSK